MSTQALTDQQKQEIRRQVGGLLGRAPAFRSLPPQQQREISEHTARVVEGLAAGPRGGDGDPYAQALTQWAGSGGSSTDTSGDAVEGEITGNVEKLLRKPQAEIGTVIGAGVTEAARMVHEIDFPAFVASLIEGTFHAIVRSSIEQMQAYAEMVKSVSSSISDFRDQNTTDNQARDHLVQKYPQHFYITVVEGEPRVGLREGADDLPVPNFRRDLGLSVDVSSLDEDMIEQQLVPAARDDLARGRQQLLATVILMGINRIVVTDGKINAKIKFQFSAREQQQRSASAYDYAKMGNVYTSEGSYEQGFEGERKEWSGGGWWGRSRSGNDYAKGEYKSSVTPDVRVTSQVDTSSVGAIQASGQIMGEVSINFKSESFPLEKMVHTDQMMHLQQAQQGAGRGAPPAAPAEPAAAPAPPAGAAPAAK